MQLNRNKDSSPMYYQIKEYIKEKIEIGEYKIGDFIPSEINLKDQFNVSRATITKALDELLKEGYISKEKGKGTVVINNISQATFKKLLTHSDSFLSGNIKDYTLSNYLYSSKLPSSYSTILDVDEGYEAKIVETEIYSKDITVALLQTIIKNDIILPKKIDKSDLDLRETFEKYNDIDIVKKKEKVYVFTAPEDILSMKKGSLIVKFTRIYYTDKDIPISFTNAFINPLDYEYSVEMGV
jgi:GntR family transcriptional regulator